MSFIKTEGVKITGISACVPKMVHKNFDMVGIIPPEEVEKTIRHIGIEEKRIVKAGQCASDLCFKAADELLNNMEVNRNSIDMILFLSQSPDYIIPATSPKLQHRLGLQNSTAALDLNLACSGYVYGLATAFAFASLPGIDKVLFLDGEAFSKIINPYDKINAPLYGDAGTATLIEKIQPPNLRPSYFSLFSDGSGENAIKIEAGGSRLQTTIKTLEPQKCKDGSVRSLNELYMNGVDVFNFTLREVPRNIKYILENSKIFIDDIDYFVFHQANKFMIDYFAKKLKIDETKVPQCMGKFGNTSSSSIPLNIVYSLATMVHRTENKKILLSGFGAGLSWASAIIDFEDVFVNKLIED